jgi:hypothetical protein
MAPILSRRAAKEGKFIALWWKFQGTVLIGQVRKIASLKPCKLL